MDDSSYRLKFDPGKKTKSVTTARKSMLNLVKLRADKIATFGPKVAILSARNTKIYKKRLYFPHFTTFRDQTLQFY